MANVSVMVAGAAVPSDSPLVFQSLPAVEVKSAECPQRARIQIDLLLLALEALDLGSSEAILALTKELGLQTLIKNRVLLWRLRCSNPWRRRNQRQTLSLEEAKALVIVVCQLSRRLTVSIRQLLLAQEQLQAKSRSYDHHFRLADYLERFRAHFRARMNSNRPIVAAYCNSEEKLNELALTLLTQLLICTGTSGLQRCWVSLFDGEMS
jgi:hypothetical protein